MRVSELLGIVDLLEPMGFVTFESLKDLTDEQAEQLDIPLKLAADLRLCASKSQPEWVKKGPVPRIVEEDPDEREEENTPGAVGPPYPAWGTYDAYQQRFAVANLVTGGFPQPLREYSEPAESVAGSIGPNSPREGWSIDKHVMRLQSARDRREDPPMSRRATNRSRSPPDPEVEPDLLRQWGATSNSHRSSCAVFSKAKSRSVLGAANPRHCVEMCRDLAPAHSQFGKDQKDGGSAAERSANSPEGGSMTFGNESSTTSKDLGSPLTMPPRWARKPGASPSIRSQAGGSPRLLSLDGSMRRDLTEDWDGMAWDTLPDQGQCPRVCPPDSARRGSLNKEHRLQQKAIGGYMMSPRIQARRKVKSAAVPPTQPMLENRAQLEATMSFEAPPVTSQRSYQGSSIATSAGRITPRTPRTPF